jgi:hypothetical protein
MKKEKEKIREHSVGPKKRLIKREIEESGKHSCERD